MNELKKMLEEISELNKTHGVTQKGGKKYNTVAQRVEIFRKHLGTTYGIQTFLKHDDGKRIVMKAIVKSLEGDIIGSGYAEEIRGQGYVNKTSAMENAESSAIGRALACAFALHGGEYASANEMDTAQRNERASNLPVSEQKGGKSTRTNQDLKDAIQRSENAKYRLSYPGNKSEHFDDIETAIESINKWLWTVETYEEKPKDQRLMAIGAFFEQNKPIMDIMRNEKPDELAEIDARVKRFEDE